jgi:hypothetical protein
VGANRQHNFLCWADLLRPKNSGRRLQKDWQAVLHKTPRIAYFKFNEAMGLKKQFDKKSGWDEATRDKKLDDLTSVIKRHVSF